MGGVGSDWTLAWIAKRKKGFFKPEYRWWCLFAVIIFGPIGLLLWGCGLGNHLHSTVAISGVGITYAVLCAGASVALTYVVDSYRSIAGEATTILIAFRNTFAFGLTFAVFPWLENDGFIKVSLLNSRICNSHGCRPLDPTLVRAMLTTFLWVRLPVTWS